MIECKNLSVGYDGETVIGNVTFSPVKGAFTVIVGSNGCGKSTLLKAIMGQADVLEGSITLDGRPLKEWGSRLARRIAYLPQNRSDVNLPVSRMVLHGRFPYMGYPRHYTKEDHRKVNCVLEQLAIRHLQDCPVSELSGGEKQKAYLAMALVQDADILLLDEPTTFLDVSAQLELLNLLKELTVQGKTILAVLHDLNHALRYADRILAITGASTGQSVQLSHQAYTGAVYDTPQSILASGLLEQIFNLRIRPLQDESGCLHYVFSLKTIPQQL